MSGCAHNRTPKIQGLLAGAQSTEGAASQSNRPSRDGACERARRDGLLTIQMVIAPMCIRAHVVVIGIKKNKALTRVVWNECMCLFVM